MSAAQSMTKNDALNTKRCAHCDSVLPGNAMFCSTCGEPVEAQSPRTPAEQPATVPTKEHYRVTSLIHRNTFTQILLALDLVHQRPVIIRDIDVTSLSNEDRRAAIQAVQQEYDTLRRQRIPGVTPLIDLRCSEEHLITVAGWPFVLPENVMGANSKAYTHTLHDLLQSGIGLPGEYIALKWLYQLSAVIGKLHSHNILLGDLDPSTIVTSNTTYDSMPVLTVSWLPIALRTLLKTTTNNSVFMAPEARLDTVEIRSDIYSMGTLLYLLLTGFTPDEPTGTTQRPWHKLREVSPRISGATEAIVIRALSFDPTNRFSRVEEMEEALLLALEQLSEHKRARTGYIPGKPGKKEVKAKNEGEEVTISIVSLQTQLGQAGDDMVSTPQSHEKNTHELVRGAIADTPTISTAHIREALFSDILDTPQPLEDEELEDETPHLEETLPEPMPRATPVPSSSPTGGLPTFQRFRERITAVIPAIKARTQAPQEPSQAQALPKAHPQAQADASDQSFLKRLQRFLLGEQQHTTTAAALIETPLRMQPNQSFTIRIRLMGREVATLPAGAKKGAQPVGLSAIVRDEIVNVEVRSATYQNYAYTMQKAEVCMPGDGFAAEILIPMRALSDGPGRRERINVFFMDEAQRPLYEKPFTVEVFVSPLVQPGREGHTVLTIPL